MGRTRLAGDCSGWHWIALLQISTGLLAPAGARADLQVCVITPRTELTASGQAAARVVLPRPTLLTADPLQELRLESSGRLLWQRRAVAGVPLTGPISWPLAAMAPQQQLTLLLQPVGADADAFARIELQAADATELQAHQRLVASLGSDGAAWLAAIDAALQRNDVALAWALLYATQEAHSAELDDLRREVFERGCGD